MPEIEWTRLIVLAGAAGVALLLARMRAARWVLGVALLVASVALGAVGVVHWLRLDSFEQRVALGITSPDAKSPDAYWAQARARDAGVPLMLSLASASAGLLLITWAAPRATGTSTNRPGIRARRPGEQLHRPVTHVMPDDASVSGPSSHP